MIRLLGNAGVKVVPRGFHQGFRHFILFWVFFSCRILHYVMVIVIFHSWVGLVRFGEGLAGSGCPWSSQPGVSPSVQSRNFNHCSKMGVCASLQREERWGSLWQASLASGDNPEMFICSRGVVRSRRAEQINGVAVSWEKQGHGCEERISQHPAECCTWFMP